MKKLTANWGLKLISLIFAVIVWFLVTNIDDPITSVRYTNIPVTLKNANLITDQGQVYTILDGSDTISSVTLYAPRSIIDSLSQNNVIATADIQELSGLNTVSIKVTTNKYSDKIENIVTSSDVVKLSVERKASKSLVLSATTSGSIADGYIIGDVTTEQNMIRITGPESVVNSVASASVDVDVTGFTSNIGTDADVELFDAEGNNIDTSLVNMNIKSVRVNVVIYETKYVPITYAVTGEAADGYMFTGEVESSPEEVLIAGRSNVLDPVSEIKVTDEGMDVTGLTGNMAYTYDLSDYLPSGIIFGDRDYNGSVSVIVHVEPIALRTLDVNVNNVAVEGIAEGYRVSVDDSEYKTVSVTIQGLKESVDKVDPDDLTGTVNVEELIEASGSDSLTVGNYSADVKWSVPSGVRIKGTVSVYIKVEKEE
ncbi:CdaR family protein [Butyrivibrio sp. FCS014]|uniref:CdaR family protein n=1 Tax=Butyrivibrio sp. FCS014 TaxID=1408304 RepID=UPI00046737EB|nr:CdaR family protein [Butyrivibrio sp. FCS014]